MAANGSEKAFCVLTFHKYRSITIVQRQYRAPVRYVTKAWSVVLLNKEMHILLLQVYCVWRVIKASTIISNNPIYKPLDWFYIRSVLLNLERWTEYEINTQSSVLEIRVLRKFTPCFLVDCVWNVMAHAQKPDFVFRWNGRVHLSQREVSVQSTTGSWGVRISGINAGYTKFQGSVKGTGYLLHSPVSPSLPLPCVTMCHRVSTGP
jgi:hypothetical protein